MKKEGLTKKKVGNEQIRVNKAINIRTKTTEKMEKPKANFVRIPPSIMKKIEEKKPEIKKAEQKAPPKKTE